jgi:bacterioferritin
MAAHEYKESIEEMQHADLFIKRILLLGGLPNLQELGKLFIGENVKEILECDLKLEIDGIATYRAAIKICEDAQDYVSRDLFMQILRAEENHADNIQTQLDLIAKIGIQNFIQLNSDAVGVGEG